MIYHLPDANIIVPRQKPIAMQYHSCHCSNPYILSFADSSYEVDPISSSLAELLNLLPFPRPNHHRIHPRKMIINRIFLLVLGSLIYGILASSLCVIVGSNHKPVCPCKLAMTVPTLHSPQYYTQMMPNMLRIWLVTSIEIFAIGQEGGRILRTELIIPRQGFAAV